MKPFVFQNGVALVTGAASGIGRALAEGLAAQGCHLALLDRDAAGLAAVAGAVRQRGVEASTHVFDLTQRDGLDVLAADVLATHSRVTLLVNNAGVALEGRFEEVSLDEFEWLIDINFHATVALTKVFLPHLLAAQGAHLVNLSSVFGLVAPEGQAAYASSKFAVRGFTEALRHELSDRVGVTVVHPGGVKTNIAASARISTGTDEDAARAGAQRFTENVRTSPEEAAAAILRAVKHRHGRVLIGSDARLIDAVQRLFPVTYWHLLKNAIERSVGPERNAG